MTERILNILKRQGKNIHCLFDGELIETLPQNKLRILIEQIEQIGSIRKNIAIFDQQLKPEAYEVFINGGISPMIVASDKDVYLALECLDIINNQQIDILCVGVNDESMLPILVEAREKSEVLLVGRDQETIKNYMPYVDYSITLSDI